MGQEVLGHDIEGGVIENPMQADRVKKRLAQEGFPGCFSVRKYWCTHSYAVSILFDKGVYSMLDDRSVALHRAEEIAREEYGSHFGVAVRFVTRGPVKGE